MDPVLWVIYGFVALLLALGDFMPLTLSVIVYTALVAAALLRVAP